nr:hypothetical protein [Alphaproteobacteria bacterium]
MKKLWDAFSFAICVLAVVFSAANACTADQITLNDNSCVDVKFTITTTSIKNTRISINLSAQGTFYIEWENGVVDTINRDNTTNETYT